MTLHFPFLECQATYAMTEFRRCRSKERTKSVCSAAGTLPDLPYPQLLQCQVSLAQGEETPCPLPQHQPRSRAATSTSGPCCCRDRGHRLSHRAPHSPRGAGCPRQCPAQLGAAGCEHVSRFLQHCSSKRNSRAQARYH